MLTHRPATTDVERLAAFLAGEPKIDWESPQSNGLVAAWPMTATHYEYEATQQFTALRAGGTTPYHTSPIVHPRFGMLKTRDWIADTSRSECRHVTLPLESAISCWAWRTSATQQQTIVSTAGERSASGFPYYGKEISFGATFGFTAWYGAGTSGASGNYTRSASGGGWLSDTWYHIVVCYDGVQAIRIYRNGEDVTSLHPDSGTAATYNDGAAYDTWIGEGIWGGKQTRGGIADLRLYRRPLTADEVLEQYANPELLYQPEQRTRRYFPFPGGGPVYPTPDNFLQASGRPIDIQRFASTFPRTNPGMSETCSPGTRPDVLSVLFQGALHANGGANYSTADWIEVVKHINNVHLLPRIMGNHYEKVLTVDVGVSPIEITFSVDFDSDGPRTEVSVVSTGGQVDPTNRVEHWSQAEPYNCSTTYDTFTFESGTTTGDVGEGFADLSQMADPEVMPSAAPAESGELIWEYDPLNSFTVAEWDFERQQLPQTNPSSRPEGDGSYATFLQAPFGYNNPSPQDYGIRHTPNYEIPEMGADGHFEAIAYDNATDGHTQIG